MTATGICASEEASSSTSPSRIPFSCNVIDSSSTEPSSRDIVQHPVTVLVADCGAGTDEVDEGRKQLAELYPSRQGKDQPRPIGPPDGSAPSPDTVLIAVMYTPGESPITTSTGGETRQFSGCVWGTRSDARPSIS